MHWDAVNEPDPYSPIGSKGIGEPRWAPRQRGDLRYLRRAGWVYLHRTPVTADMILNALEGQPQSYKPLEVNV